MPRNHKQILEEAFLPDVWNLVVRFLDSSKGASLVVISSLLAIQYVGPGPFILIAGVLEMGFSGSYLDAILKKHLRHSVIKDELMPVADAVIDEVAKDNQVTAQVRKLGRMIKDLKSNAPKDKSSIVTAASNLKNEIKNSEKIVSSAIDRAIKSNKLEPIVAEIPHNSDYVKRAITNALTITPAELQSALQY